MFGKLVGFYFPLRFLPVSVRELSELADASFLFHDSFISTAGDGLDSRRRVVSIQHINIRSPAFRAAGVIMAVSFFRTDCGTFS
jgi:hypothetical protein